MTVCFLEHFVGSVGGRSTWDAILPSYIIQKHVASRRMSADRLQPPLHAQVAYGVDRLPKNMVEYLVTALCSVQHRRACPQLKAPIFNFLLPGALKQRVSGWHFNIDKDDKYYVFLSLAKLIPHFYGKNMDIPIERWEKCLHRQCDMPS